jgi:hypothetical protein
VSESKTLEVFKAVLSSQVGGWIMACLIIAAMAWVTYKDRQILYQEIIQLRTELRPVVEEDNRVLKEILEIVKHPKQ